MTPPINIDGTNENYSNVTIDGQDVEQITIDGQDVLSTIPDFLVTQYQFEDEGDTTTAIDSIGSNNADLINSPTYSTTAARGDHALQTNGSDSFARSQSAVDLSALGDTVGASVGGFFNPDNTNDAVPAGWGSDSSNLLEVEISNGNWAARIQGGGQGFARAESSVSVDTSSYQHVVAASDGTDVFVIVDGTEEARTSYGNVDLIGSGKYRVGVRAAEDILFYPGLSENVFTSYKAVTESEAQQLI